MKQENMFIGGEWVESVSGETFPDFNPATGELFAQVSKANLADVDRAMSAALAARKGWAHTEPSERAGVLHATSETLKKNLLEFNEVLVAETGARLDMASFEINCTVGLLHAAAQDCRKVFGESMPLDNGKGSMTLHQPLGTVVVISSWSSPLWSSMKKVAYALAAGNTVVLNPSKETPVIGLRIARLFEKAGLPAGVVNVVTWSDDTLQHALVEDERASFISFAGETDIEKEFVFKTSAGLEKCRFELEGNHPLIVLKDADVESAVNAAASGIFLHQGQIPVSFRRLIVEIPLVEEFSRALTSKAKSLSINDASQPNSLIGPVISDELVKKIHSYVNDAVTRGATLLTGGSFEYRIYKPTVLINVTREMLIFQEQIFGPVAPIITVRNENDALTIANCPNSGFSAGVITSEQKRAMFLAENLNSRFVYVNDALVQEDSGLPAECSENSFDQKSGHKQIEEMCRVKRVLFE